MEWKKLPEVCDIKTGKKDANHAKENGKYRFYTCANHYSLCDTYSFSGESVIVPGNGDIGLVFYYDGNFEAYQRTYVLSNIKIYAKYLYYYFVYKWRSQNTSKQFGSTVKYVRMQNFNDFLVPVPPLPEQQRIVAKIEELFAELDNSVAMLKKVKEQLEVYRQAVLKEQIFQNNFEKLFITDVIEENKYSIKAGPFGSSLKKSFYIPRGYKVYGQEQVIAGDENFGNYYVGEDKYKELISCSVKPFDLLISLVGTVGKVLILSENCQEGIINPRLIKITLDKKKMLPEFFKFYFESGYFKRIYKEQLHGETMDVMNLKILKKLPFPKLSIKEQREIINNVNEKEEKISKLEYSIVRALQQADALRQSILKKAFVGEL